MNPKLMLFMLLVLGVLCENQSYAQISGKDKAADPSEEIAKTFRLFFDATERKDGEAIVKYVYPRLFEFFPKEAMIEAMDKMNSDTTISIQFEDSKIDSISSPIKIDDLNYAIVSYSFSMIMEMNESAEEESEDDDFSALDFTYEILLYQFGKDKVTYDEANQQIKIDIVTRAIAINENEESGWTFLEYKTEQMAILKQLIPEEILKMAAPEPAACAECASLEDALSNPEMVESLIVSKDLQGVDIDHLPASIGELKNVKIMYLTGHSFTTVPKEIGALQQLEELSFSGCKLTSLPDEIFGLKNLKELLLYDHDFSEEYLEELKVKFKEKMPDTEVEFE